MSEYHPVLDKEVHWTDFFQHNHIWVDKDTQWVMIINGSLNDTHNSIYITENLFKCSYKFQTLAQVGELVLQSL